MLAELNLTKTQRRMMDVLSDGLPHTKAELSACVNDELGCESLLSAHLSNLRGKLVEVGLNVIHVRGEYMLMQRLHRPE